MKRASLFPSLIALAALACGGTAHHRVLDPPRLDLKPWGQVGLAVFTVEGAKGSLHELATQRFSESVLAAQPGIEVLELGSADSAPAAEALAAARGVPVVFFGHLKVSKLTPSGGMYGLNLPHLEATISAELSVGLFSTKSGGTLWRASSKASDKVGGIALIGGEPFFDAKNPNKAYANLVDRLVHDVTWDLRPTWRDE